MQKAKVRWRQSFLQNFVLPFQEIPQVGDGSNVSHIFVEIDPRLFTLVDHKGSVFKLDTFQLALLNERPQALNFLGAEMGILNFDSGLANPAAPFLQLLSSACQLLETLVGLERNSGVYELLHFAFDAAVHHGQDYPEE